MKKEETTYPGWKAGNKRLNVNAQKQARGAWVKKKKKTKKEISNKRR